MTRQRFFAAAFLLLLGACGRKDDIARTTVPPASVYAESETCRVTRVVDGDTFECQVVGRVRFIGIDAPEMTQVPFGEQSRAELRRLMHPGTTVRLQQDVSRTDVFGRRLAYVYVDDILINEALVERGFAIAARYPPDTSMASRLEAAEKSSRAARRGLWGTDGFSCRPSDWRRKLC